MRHIVIHERAGGARVPRAAGRNGQQGIAVLAAHPEVRAVVLDLAMLVMSGDTAGPMMRSLRPDGCE